MLELEYLIEILKQNQKYETSYTRYLSSGSMAPDVDRGSRGATPYFLQTPLPSLTVGVERARYSVLGSLYIISKGDIRFSCWVFPLNSF